MTFAGAVHSATEEVLRAPTAAATSSGFGRSGFTHWIEKGQKGNPKADSSGSSTATQGDPLALSNHEHYLSDIRTAAGALAARMFAPPNVRTAAVLGAGAGAYWQALALDRERPSRPC